MSSKFMKYGPLFAAFLGTILSYVAFAGGAMTDCIDATCRIRSPDGGTGTGCVFEVSQGQVYVLTAAHVVEGGNSATLEFWSAGHQSIPLPGTVVAKSISADAAIIAVPEGAFGGILPKMIPIAPRDHIVSQGETLTSVGCANGTWSTGWKGHALGYSGSDLHFIPTPANGRSGSAIFDADGKMIVAVLRARTGNDSEGIATSVQSLYYAFGNRTKQSQTDWRESPDANLAQCPGGQCPQNPQQGNQYRFLPYRQQQEGRQTPQGQGISPAWPTLPLGAAPSAPAVDLGPTNEKLDKIADLLIQQFLTSNPPPAAQIPLPAPVDDTARKTADEAKAAATEAKTQSDKIADKLGRIDAVFEKFGSDPEALIQKALDRVNKVQQKLGPEAEGDDIAKAYVKDLLKEKIKEGITGALSFDKLVSVGGGIPAVGLAIFACVVVWKLVNNKPLAIEKIAPDSFLGQRAADLREHISSALAPIKNEIDSKLNHITGMATDASAAAAAAKTIAQMAASTSSNPTGAAK